MVIASAAQPHPATAALRVLVVEDDPDTAAGLVILLSLAGHDVRAVHTGSAALEAARACEPDVVLLDIGLGGMTGYDVARQLRERNARKKPFLIALTGYAHAEARRRSAEAGIDLHLVKPVAAEELAALLTRFRRVIAGE